MNAHVIRAIFRRNFVSYFSNPTGYVFICVFVLMSSIAAFWPNEFFNDNLANLDQLNRWLPYILLVFVPAVTMSIWAEERRQGTDELLLTIPATDFDVVLGKYLAAGAIYSVSLLFSFISNWIVLQFLGEPDLGLFIATYVGYWIVGLAMVSVGMVASFLTGNQTVAFVLGVIFNAPLAFAGLADAIIEQPAVAATVGRWSIASQFRDFSRGVISLSSIAYFIGLVALMLYLCMVLIGRRHWRGGPEGRGVAGHYLVRFLALAGIVLALDVFLSNHDRLRADVSSAGLSSLSPATRQLLKKIDDKTPPIKIYAFVSNEVPENYIPAKLNLLSTLSEIKAAAGGKVQVYLRQIDPLSDEATVAEQQFNIRPEKVEGRVRGARSPVDIFMGVAVTCGLDKVVLPFLGKGLPPEYELIRSIATVSQQKRKKIGVVTTDAKLYGGFDFQSMASTPNQLIIDELQKQYDLVQVDPANPIKDRYDVLLAVQPSSLPPGAMEHFIAAVKSGQPTAIFEDPFPAFAPDVPGTLAPKQPPGGMNPFMQQRQPPQPKGDVSKLWRALGIDFNGREVVWQNFNPYPHMNVPREFVFTEQGAMPEPYNEDDIVTSGLQELLFPLPGSVSRAQASSLKFSALVSATAKERGIVPYDQIYERGFGGMRPNPNLPYLEKATGDSYVLAARISGKLKPENLPMSDKSPEDGSVDSDSADSDSPGGEPPAGDRPDDESPLVADGHDHDHDHADGHDHEHLDAEKGAAAASAEPAAPPKDAEIDAVVVCDIDCLYSVFFMLRQRGAEEGDEVDWRFENVTFVLNVLDSLAGDDNLIEIRKHRPVHRTLSKVSEKTEPLTKRADEEKQEFNKAFERERDKAQSDFDQKIAQLTKNQEMTDELMQRLALAKRDGQQRLSQKIERLKQQRDRQVEQNSRELAKTLRNVQNNYKLGAVLLPPILPLAVALAVFFNRRAREREGVNKTRLRS